MDAQALLSKPHSQLTRKERRERAALKGRLRRELRIPMGYAIGRVTPTDSSGLAGKMLSMDGSIPKGGTVLLKVDGADFGEWSRRP